jgi:hypothetical protein
LNIVRVFFLDNSSKTILLEGDATIAELICIILDKLDIIGFESFVPYFGIYESLNGNAIGSIRGMDEIVSEIVRNWSDNFETTNAKLVFMIRLYMPSLWGLEYRDIVAKKISKRKKKMSIDTYLKAADIMDASLLHLQYIQAVYHIITGIIIYHSYSFY